MKVEEEDCSHHMFVTAPLPIFINSSVKEHRIFTFGESAHRLAHRCYEELNNKEVQCVKGSLTITIITRIVYLG